MSRSETEGCAEVINPYADPKLTVGRYCDLRIEGLRKQLESACIAKAKLEALQMLDHPYHRLQNLLSGGSDHF